MVECRALSLLGKSGEVCVSDIDPFHPSPSDGGRGGEGRGRGGGGGVIKCNQMFAEGKVNGFSS